MKKYTKLQELMLLNAHPAKNVLNLLGAIILCILITKGDWLRGIVFGFALIFSGTAIAALIWKIPVQELGHSFWGKITLRFTEPWSFVLYLISHVLIPTFFLFNNYYLLLVGIVCYLIPQIVYLKKY